MGRQAVEAVVEKKMAQKQAAYFFHVSSYAIHKWVKAYKAGGSERLPARPQGRPKTEGTLLLPWQQAQIVWAMTDKCRDQLQLTFILWTRNALRQLMKQRFGVDLSIPTMSR